MRLHGTRCGYGVCLQGGRDFCMIAVEFGGGFMALIYCIGKGEVGVLVFPRGHGMLVGRIGLITIWCVLVGKASSFFRWWCLLSITQQ